MNRKYIPEKLAVILLGQSKMFEKQLTIWDWVRGALYLIVSIAGCSTIARMIFPNDDQLSVIFTFVFWIVFSIILFNPPPGRSE